jgi:hypothetical protein
VARSGLCRDWLFRPVHFEFLCFLLVFFPHLKNDFTDFLLVQHQNAGPSNILFFSIASHAATTTTSLSFSPNLARHRYSFTIQVPASKDSVTIRKTQFKNILSGLFSV